MIVEEIRIRGATIRVHDDSYVNRTKEEIQSSMPDMVEVNPDTLCQCTGLTDERGQKIWENDICNRKEKYPEIVTYNKGDWQLDYLCCI